MGHEATFRSALGGLSRGLTGPANLFCITRRGPAGILPDRALVTIRRREFITFLRGRVRCWLGFDKARRDGLYRSCLRIVRLASMPRHSFGGEAAASNAPRYAASPFQAVTTFA